MELVMLERDFRGYVCNIDKIPYHIHKHACTHTCTHTHAHACTHAHMHTCMHICIHACTHVCMHTRTHTCMHTCTHTHIYAHTHSLTTFLTIAGLCCRILLTILAMSTTPSFSTCSRTLSMVMNVPVRPTPALCVCVYAHVC